MVWKPDQIRQHMQMTKRDVIVFISAIVCGLLAHMYMLTNKLPNYDDVLATFTGCGRSFDLGRWGLRLIYEIRVLLIGDMSMPWLNGVFSLAVLALSAVYAVRILDIEDYGYAAVTGGILTVFPTIVSMMFFMFTAPYYALAILSGTIGVYCLERKKHGWIGAVILWCLSISIYQAYITWIAGLLILTLIKHTLEEKEVFQEILKKSFIYAGILLASLGVYFVINKAVLSWQGISMSDYQGLNEIGVSSLSDILNSIKKIYYLYIDFRIHEYAGITTSKLLRFILCGFFVADIVSLAGYITAGKQSKENKWKNFALIVLCVLFPIAVFAIYIMANEHTMIYTLMLYSVSLIMVMPMLLADKMKYQNVKLFYQKMKSFFNIAVFIGGISAIYIFIHVANEHYTWMQIDYNRSMSYLTTVITQVKETEGYTGTEPVAFIAYNGKIKDATLNHEEYDYLDITIGGVDAIINMYSMDEFIQSYCGFAYIPATREEIAERYEQIQSMPVYPAKGAIQKIDGIIVVKFQEP